MLRLTYFFNRGKKKFNYFNSRLARLERKLNMVCATVYGKKKTKKKCTNRGPDGRFICKTS